MWRCVLLLFFYHHAVAQCSMRLQVRTTSLQQRSADRPPGIWLLCVYSWRRRFFLPAQSPPNRWISRVGWKIGENTSPRGRQPERIAKAGAVHRGGKLRCCCLFYFIFFPPSGFVKRGAESGAPLRGYFYPNTTKWKS